MNQLVATAGHTIAGLSRSQLFQILDLARWAPSGDNCQPWRVCPSDDGRRLDVYCDPSQKPAFLDINQEASRIAIGAFIENVCLAASMQSIHAEVHYDDSGKDTWATLSFRPEPDATTDPLAAVIKDRVSNRRHYERGSVSLAELDSLRKAADDSTAASVQFFSNREQLAAIGRAVGLAEQVRMQQRDCHREFHAKVRWTAEEVRRNPTGFYVATFEVKPYEAWLLRMTRSYGVMRFMDTVGQMSRIAGAVARGQVRSSGAIGVLAVADYGPATLMRTGRAFQRVWLTATQLGLSMQVLAVTNIFLRRQVLRMPGFTPAMCRKLARARGGIEAVMSRSDVDSVVLMFRVGRAAPPTARTDRVPGATLFG